MEKCDHTHCGIRIIPVTTYVAMCQAKITPVPDTTYYHVTEHIGTYRRYAGIVDAKDLAPFIRID